MIILITIIRTMHIYHALINALRAHMIHINLKTIFYTHAEHSHTKTKTGGGNTHTLYTHSHTHTHIIHSLTHTHTHTDCSRK